MKEIKATSNDRNDENNNDGKSRTDNCLEYASSSKKGVSFVSGNTFDLKKIVYSIINGLAVFEGDIILGTADEMDRRKMRPTAEIIKGNNFRWPQSVIPYVIDDKFPDKNRITDAIDHWEENTPIRFILRGDWNARHFPNYLIFQSFSENWCNSAVGRRGIGEQQCNLSVGCLKGQVIHEIGHVVGLWHEQSRNDRDQYVTINWDNIDPTKTDNFDQHITDGEDVGSYDYCSIMHYSANAFSRNSRPTIAVRHADYPCANAIGQRNGLSTSDIIGVIRMYNSLVPAVGKNADGRLEVFIVGREGQLYHKFQTAPNNGWFANWIQKGGNWSLGSNPSVISNADGRLEVFIVGRTKEVYHKWQTAPNNDWFENWISLGGSWPAEPVAAQNYDGRIELFLIGYDRQLYHKWHTAPNNGWSDGWKPLGGVWNYKRRPAILCDHYDMLFVFLVGYENELYYTSQISPGVQWADNWVSLGGSWPSDPIVARDADKRLYVFVIGDDGKLYYKRQTAPWSYWQDQWISLDGQWPFHRYPTALANADGRLEVFLVGETGQLYHKWQTTPNGDWVDHWETLGGIWSLGSNPYVISNADGRLEVFLIGEDGQLYHKWQTTPNNGWTNDWESRGGIWP